MPELYTLAMPLPCLCEDDSRLAATKKHNLQALPERKADIARCQRDDESSPQLQRKVCFFVYDMPAAFQATVTDRFHPHQHPQLSSEASRMGSSQVPFKLAAA